MVNTRWRKIRGVLYLIVGVALGWLSFFAGPILYLTYILTVATAGLLLALLPPLILGLSFPIWAVAFFVRGIHLVRRPPRPDWPWYRRYLLPILVLVPLVFVIVLTHYERPLDLPKEGRSYPEWISVLPETEQARAKDEFDLAYQVMASMYDKPPPATPEEYLSYWRCATHIIGEIRKMDPLYSTYSGELQELDYRVEGDFEILLKHLADQIDYNKSMRYSRVMGGFLFESGKTLIGDETHCRDKDVPERYK